jgi:CheY-like chemotaxis protein
LRKTALIVDDSKSARVVLKRMLETYDLNVDTSESAEEALDYLVSHRPDVIFMDHLMPGMDGFEAVSAIKKNPDTAMIPIMMYTSQEGEVYVGQARALGAVGVLPKTVKPVEVSKVLASLHLAEEPPADSVAEAEPPPARDASPTDNNLRLLLQDLFDQQRVILQRELRDTYSDLAARFASELKPHAETKYPGPADLREDPRHMRWLAGAIVGVLVFVLVLAWQQRDINALREQNRLLADSLAIQPIERNTPRQDVAGYQRALAGSRAALLDALEWGVNEASGYAWNEIPLGEYRLQLFDELLSRLMAIGYSGSISVAVHVGDFCMVDDGRGLLELAPDDLPAADCEQIGLDPVESLSLGYRQSVGFANFIVMADERTGGAIEIAISSAGNSQPLIAYPETTAGLTAGDWNSIARQNHRVAVELAPEQLP